jgi:hypothetical protein
MIEILSAVFGFFAPFGTEIFKFFQRKQDNSHELAVMKLQGEIKSQEHMYRMEEISATTDLEEVKLVHAPANSFGVQLLDAAKANNLSSFVIYPAFYLFVIMDFMASMVRPAVTYTAFGFYILVKWAQLQVAISNNGDFHNAILATWTSSDMSIVILVLSYWFGQRAVKAAFGGSANTAYKA